MNTKYVLSFLVLLITAMSVSAFVEVGDNLVESRSDTGNFLIYNEGYISYSIFADNGNYTGTIKHNQGIYLNESLSYTVYASYDELRDFGDIDIIEEKFNQWWLIVVIGILLLIGLVIVIKTIWKR